MGKYCFALIVVLIVGCGGPQEHLPTTTYRQSADLLGAFNNAGLACTGYEKVAIQNREMGTQAAVDVGACNLEGENIKMVIWKDIAQKENWVGLGKKFGCEMGKNFGILSYDFVDGGQWTISDTTQTLSEKISEAIGGKAIHVDCD